MNIYEKLLNITNEIKNVNKNLEVGIGKNSYKAVGEADVLKAVKELEFKYKIYSYPFSRKVIDSNILETEKEYNGQVTKGNQLYLRIETIYRFINIENTEEFIDITTYGDGIDTQDKAVGKAMTYSDKYALLKAYKIITGEDPDQNASPEKVTYKKSEAGITSGQVKYLQSLYSADEIIPLLKELNKTKVSELTVVEASKLIENKKGANE